MNAINANRAAKDISTFDFSTLYTKLPHNDLLRVLHILIDFVFDGKNFRSEKKKRYLTITDQKTYWSNKNLGKSYTKENIKELVTHLVRSCFFEFGNLTFVQKVGIPMGLDPAPFWANLYLYYYEKNHVTSLMSSDPQRARKFKYASRFIDDQGNLNDGGEFGRSCHLIYPDELDLKCEHQGIRATYLEMDICIEDSRFVYKLFDKRDDFPFNIVRMPDLKANIPDHIFYGSFLAEVLRISRATLLYQDFIPRAKEIFKRMVNQGGSHQQLKKQIYKMINRYPDTFSKYTITPTSLINTISQT